jgi:hypothetical protein
MAHVFVACGHHGRGDRLCCHHCCYHNQEYGKRSAFYTPLRELCFKYLVEKIVSTRGTVVDQHTLLLGLRRQSESYQIRGSNPGPSSLDDRYAFQTAPNIYLLSAGCAWNCWALKALGPEQQPCKP